MSRENRNLPDTGKRRKTDVPLLDYKEIGGNIRQFRKARKLTLEKLAEMVGIQSGHTSNIENGKALSLPVFVAIANALHISGDAILGTNLLVSNDIHPSPDTSTLDKEMIIAKFMSLIGKMSTEDAQKLMQIVPNIIQVLDMERP